VGGFYEISVYLAKRDESGDRVEMSWRIFRPAEASPKHGVEDQHATLLDGVTEIQFAYFGWQGQKESARWYNDWQNLSSLPDLIRLHIQFIRSGHRWPELVVAPKVRSLTPIIEPPF
jgi:hypothetical protein